MFCIKSQYKENMSKMYSYRVKNSQKIYKNIKIFQSHIHYINLYTSIIIKKAYNNEITFKLYFINKLHNTKA